MTKKIELHQEAINEINATPGAESLSDVATPKVQLGQAVEYRDSKGRSKAAWVIGTPESCADTDLACEKNEIHVFVVSPSGQPYVRHHCLHAEDEPLAGTGSWRLLS